MNKKILALAIAGVMTAPMAAQAVKYKLSGQVNRAVVFMDDGEKSAVRNVDSTSSGTRFRLKGSQDIGNGIKAGMYWETQFQSSRSFSQRPNQNADGSNGGAGDLRQANVFFTGNWGKLTIGQTDGAGNGATESDWVPSGAYHGRTSFTGGLRWRTSGGAGITTGGGLVAAAGGAVDATGTAAMTESSTFNEFDAFSRHDVIRYDSPKLGPVTVAASIGNDSIWEVAAFADADLGGGNLLLAGFYGEDTQGVRSAGTDGRWGGSIRYQFFQGTKISGTYAQNESLAPGVPDADVFTVGVGHSWGNNTVSFHYSEATDVTPNFDDQAFNVGFDHHIPKAKIDLYASFFHTELDTPAGVASVEDHNTVVVGARVKFK